ncbi:MAG: DeoR/GlpR transcriptional regulator, partial [Rhodospirillales bacterium]|nr:DeoR/GlpR transcriptional regulator [Rhodospirillales bacterium]
VTNFAYNSRRMIAVEGKHNIGEAAAALIPDNASVILNIGTTTEQVAKSLYRHKGLMVITNNINIANILLETSEAEVLIAGGSARRADGGIIGASAVDFIRQFKVDIAVIGASAIDEDGSLLDFDHREVRVSKAILEHARKVILVTDGMKFERKAPARIGHISEIKTFVTDVPPPQKFIDLCNEAGVEIIVAEQDMPLPEDSVDE